MTLLSAPAQQLAALIWDFNEYAARCLKIADKDGHIVPLELNSAQVYLHERIEDQLARIGRVRVIVLKGRQQGASTYVGGRFYWKATTQFGKRFAILTHLQEATDNLFAMVKRYNDSMPLALKPKTRNDNAKELSFEKLQSKYSVSTAGSRGTGRSGTAQYFHGSEVAFWDNAQKHMAGIGQVVPNADGTEIIFESTANGIGNLFHNMVLKALAGKGDFELIFIPWFWQTEYRRAVPADAEEWTPEELEYQAAFGLDFEQLYWRRLKIIDELDGDDTLFDQEYPATVEMAFMAGTSRSLIAPVKAAAAVGRHADDDCDHDALILGVDPAEYGDDDTAAVLRRGRKVLKIWRWSKLGNAQVAGNIGRIIDEHKRKGDPIDAICVDVTGVGTGVEAILSDQGHQNIYRVHNGEQAMQVEKYRNRGAECWVRMKEWTEDATRPASLPKVAEINGKVKDCNLLQAEMCSRSFTYDARRRFVLQSKEEMRDKGIPSPNVADALSLTFAVSVAPRRRQQVETLQDKLRRLATRHHSGGSPGMSS